MTGRGGCARRLCARLRQESGVRCARRAGRSRAAARPGSSGRRRSDAVFCSLLGVRPRHHSCLSPCARGPPPARPEAAATATNPRPVPDRRVATAASAGARTSAAALHLAQVAAGDLESAGQAPATGHTGAARAAGGVEVGRALPPVHVDHGAHPCRRRREAGPRLRVQASACLWAVLVGAHALVAARALAPASLREGGGAHVQPRGASCPSQQDESLLGQLDVVSRLADEGLSERPLGRALSAPLACFGPARLPTAFPPERRRLGRDGRASLHALFVTSV